MMDVVHGLSPSLNPQEVLGVIRNAREATEEEYEELVSLIEMRGEKRMGMVESAYAFLWSYCSAFIAREGYSYGVLANAEDVRKLIMSYSFCPDERSVEARGDVRLMKGWRKEVLGNDLLALLIGDKGLVWDGGQNPGVKVSQVNK